MKIAEGPWHGWEVWLEFADGKRLVEHDCKYATSKPGLSQCMAEVTVECVHEKDFKIIVQPPLNNHRDFSCCPVIDGIKIQGFAGYGYGFPHRLSISDRLEVVSDGSIVRRSLRFKKLEWTEGEKPGKCASPDELGTIEVKLSKGVLHASTNHHPYISQQPRATVAEKVKKVRLTSYVGGEVLGPYEYAHLSRLHADPQTPACSVKFTYATSGIVAALRKEAKGDTRNSVGFRNATCSPFEEDEVTLLGHQPAVKRERSSTLPASAPESTAGGNETSGRKSKKQRMVKSEPDDGASGPGPSTAPRRGKVGPKRGEDGRFVRSR